MPSLRFVDDELRSKALLPLYNGDLQPRIETDRNPLLSRVDLDFVTCLGLARGRINMAAV
jgi:hypothetical protein